MRASPLPSRRSLAVSMSCQSPTIVARAPVLARRRHSVRRRIDVVVVAAAASESSSNFTRASYIPPQKYSSNDGSVALPTRLSGTPMSREARRWFYDDAAESVDALLEAGLARRASVRLTIPETNPEQDTFRIGTLLELVRAIAVKRAKGRGERVRVVVSFFFFFFFLFFSRFLLCFFSFLAFFFPSLILSRSLCILPLSKKKKKNFSFSLLS